jgi:lipoate-protein ligase A
MNFPKTKWRLVQSAAASGAWNMAVDEAILEAVHRGSAKPTLRLYAWSPPCLSLGYAQPSGDVDFEYLNASGWQIVRRPTGGRAILHTDELTYSIICPHSEPRVAGSVLESYQRLSAALLGALQLLGIPAQALEKNSRKQNSGIQNPVCFETPSNYEITVSGKKIIGSAQARRREGILQHGSFPLFGDLTRITSALCFPDEASRTKAAARLLDHATTAEEILGHPLSWDTAAEVFILGFQQALNLELDPEELTPGELARAAELAEEKYAHSVWTRRV